ncbi:MAG: SH3 domain-containing protein [Eubacteriales bacterium]|nr:SH3 domain-containing protein [Eubacteriales bacterium]
MDDFREWLSDNLRYILLGAAILVILLVLFFGVRACSRLMKGNSGEQQGTVSQNNQGNVPSSPITDGETTDEKNTSTNPMEKDAYPAVNALIKDYYQALGEKDITALRTLVDELLPADESRIANAKDYIEGYEVKEVFTKKGIDEGDYLVYAYYNFICTGISTPVPALSQLYVKTDSDGQLKICGNMESDEQISAFTEKLLQDEDVQELVSRVNQEYEDAQNNDEALKQFLQGLGDDTDSQTDSSSSTTMTANTTCNVRAAASTDAQLLGTLYTGEQVEKTGEEGEWVQISYGDQTGYVYRDYLS